MIKAIEITVISAANLMIADKKTIQALCARAFGEDVWCDYAYLNSAFHVIGRQDERMVCHALWTDRLLSVNGHAPMKTAYVEYVATEPSLQGQGLASTLMQFLVNYVQDKQVLRTQLYIQDAYQLAALAPEDSAFYQRLGWALWLGKLMIRDEEGIIETPDDDVMVYRLAQTPQFALTDDLSAEWREGELW